MSLFCFDLILPKQPSAPDILIYQVLDKSKEVLLLKNIRINLRTEGSHRIPTPNANNEGSKLFEDRTIPTIRARR